MLLLVPVFFQLRLHSKITSFLSVKTLEIAIHALNTTRLDYCNSLYLCISKSSIALLQLVQNAAVKVLKGQCKFNHVTPILKSLHWLPVHHRIILYVLKSLNNLAPSYLSLSLFLRLAAFIRGTPRYLSDQLHPYNPTWNLSPDHG